MTKRYYYTDPLAAAWMARHHKLLFKSSRGQNLYWDGGNDFRCEKDCGFYAGEYYYIHPDSLYRLKPKVGDLVKNKFGHFQVVVESLETAQQPGLIHLTHLKGESIEIIQRNGIAFHWPKSEEV